MGMGLVAFGVVTWHRTSTRDSDAVSKRLLVIVIAVLAAVVGIGASMAPWLLSGMEEVEE